MGHHVPKTPHAPRPRSRRRKTPAYEAYRCHKQVPESNRYDHGRIIGQAKWIVFRDGMPEEIPLAGDYWESEDDKEYAKCVYEGLVEPRRMVARSAEGTLVGVFVHSVVLYAVGQIH